MKSNYKRIGSYIRLVDERNRDLKVTTLLGLTIDKVFIPSVANTIETDMANYKIIRKGQFACSLMQVRRDKKMPAALLEKYDEAIISPAYPVFEIADKESLMPEYLMMWMSRPEFDRHACFLAVGGVRGSLEWDDFCGMELPVPSIKKQREIVREYNVVTDRIKLNEHMNQKLEEAAQAIYKQWFVDFEFPITKEYAAALGKLELVGKPYKSNGGEMIFCKELDKEIPRGWSLSKLDKLYSFQYGKGNTNPDNGGIYPIYGSNGVIGGFDKFNNEDAPVVGHIGSCGSLVFAYGRHYVTYNGIMCNVKPPYGIFFGYCTLLACNLQEQVRGSTQPFVSYDMLYDIDFIEPNIEITKEFSVLIDQLFKKQIVSKKLLGRLNDLKQVLLSKMAKTREDTRGEAA